MMNLTRRNRTPGNAWTPAVHSSLHFSPSSTFDIRHSLIFNRYSPEQPSWTESCQNLESTTATRAEFSDFLKKALHPTIANRNSLRLSAEILFFNEKDSPGQTHIAYNPLIHHRRSIRLRGYDYGQAGMYYVTLCARDREHFFGEIVGTTMQLSRIGEITLECWKSFPDHFPRAILDEFVIMPEHMHGIVVLADDDSVGTRHAVSRRDEPRSDAVSRRDDIISPHCEQFSKPVKGSLSTIIRSFKSAVTKRAHEDGYSMFNWQSRFYEHIIRDGEDLDRIREYIRDNINAWIEDHQ